MSYDDDKVHIKTEDCGDGSLIHNQEVLYGPSHNYCILIQKKLNIRKNYTSHADQAVITASKDMRIDGERIHMG